MTWQSRRISDLGRVVTGKTPSTSVKEYFNGPFPFVTIPDMGQAVYITRTQRTLSEAGAQAVRGSLIPKDAVMMSCIATIGRCGLASRPSVTNQQINSVICNDEVDPRFLYYAFTQLGAALEAAGGGGSVFTNISKGRFENIEVEMPPLEAQKQITSILGALDDKIELNRRMNGTLEALAQAVFKEWFVENTEEGWETMMLDEVAYYRNGLALQRFRPKEGEEPLPAVKIAQMRTGLPDSGEWASPNIDPECILYDGDVVFSWSGSLMAILWCGGKAALNQHLFKVTSNKFPKWFYYLWTQQYMSEFQGIASNKATTMGHINRNHLKVPVPIPPTALLKRGNEVIAPLLDRLVANNLETRTLTALRDTMLPKLMRGEVRVKAGHRAVDA